MTRRERVKAAIAHKTPDKVPTFFHLAYDGLVTYNDRLWERYGRPDMRELRDQGKYLVLSSGKCFTQKQRQTQPE